MGNEQSTSSADKNKMTTEQVCHLLNEQRKMYEKKCQEVMSQANAQRAENAKAANPTTPPAYSVPPATHTPQPSFPSQPAYPPQPAPPPQPGYAQQTMHFVQNQGPSTSGQSFERQRTPYSHTREDLQDVVRASAPSAPLYPNLNNHNNPATFRFENRNSNPANDFVFVNNNGRTQPSAPSRDRSVSRPRNNNNLGSDLNCPTCKTLFGLQIYQCNRGHSSCSSCKEQGRCCGLCGNIISGMRNYALEGYVAEQKMPCANRNNGCTLSFKMSEMEIHCKECPFNEMQCPLGCFWKGQLKDLSSHFDVLHPERRSIDVNSENRLRDITNNSQSTYLILIGVFNFLFHIKVSQADRKIYMAVQLIGTKVSASKWYYEVHVYNKNEPRRKFTFNDACLSHAEPIAEIFDGGRCSVLPHTYASTFFNSGALVYKIFIKKNIDNKPRGEFGKNQRGKGRK